MCASRQVNDCTCAQFLDALRCSYIDAFTIDETGCKIHCDPRERHLGSARPYRAAGEGSRTRERLGREAPGGCPDGDFWALEFGSLGVRGDGAVVPGIVSWADEARIIYSASLRLRARGADIFSERRKPKARERTMMVRMIRGRVGGSLLGERCV